MMLFLRSALKAVFDIIRPIQYLGIIVLVQCVFPGNLTTFFMNLMEQVHFDVIEGQEIVAATDSKFINEDPYSDNFEEYQIESMNFILNSGSIVVPLIPFIFFHQFVLVKGMLYITKVGYKSWILRKIGTVAKKQ